MTQVFAFCFPRENQINQIMQMILTPTRIKETTWDASAVLIARGVVENTWAGLTEGEICPDPGVKQPAEPGSAEGREKEVMVFEAQQGAAP